MVQISSNNFPDKTITEIDTDKCHKSKSDAWEKTAYYSKYASLFELGYVSRSEQGVDDVFSFRIVSEHLR